MIPSQRTFRVKTLAFYAVHLTLPHSVLPVTASDGFTNGGIAETIDFAKQANSN